MTHNGLDAFKKKAPSKFFSFGQTPGTTCAGTITEISDQKQGTKYNRDPKAKRELDFWPSGDPVMEVWMNLQTQERDQQDPEDTGLRTLVITVNQKPGGQLAAIMDACEAVGAPTPLPGGFLALSFAGYDPNSENAQNPRKLYAAQYQAPAPGGGAFTQQQQPVQQAQYAPQPVQQAPVYNQWNPAPEQQQAYAQAYAQAPVQQYQQPPVQEAPLPATAYASPAAAPPAWAQPAPQQQAPAQQSAPAVYQPPVQVNTATGEITAPPAQQQAPVQQHGGGVDAVQIQALIAQGMDDATIGQTTGAPQAAIAAIRAIS